MKNNGFVKGAFILLVCNLVGKIIGAVYRIPLANMLGTEGIGKYQLIFPLYALLLSISSSGIPVAISKIVAEYNGKGMFADVRKLLKITKTCLCVISFFAVGLIVVFARNIASIQGNPEIYFCYYAIAPAILFVGILSVYRGYFQGDLNMLPSALSNLVEQITKLLISLALVNVTISRGIEYGVFGALLGISISELLALLFLSIYYLFSPKKQGVASLGGKVISKQLFDNAFPITLGNLAGPITAIIDSLLIVNLLKNIGFSGVEATSLLGLQAGIVDPIINIPIVLAISISASLLPNLASLFIKGDDGSIKNIIEKAFQITLSMVLVCSVCFVIFGKQILMFLYGGSLNKSELITASKLLFLGGGNLIFLSLVQITSGVLQGIGKQKFTMKTIVFGSIIKIVLTLALVSIKEVNILGAMLSGGVSYLVVFALNYREIKKHTSARFSNIISESIIQCCLVCLFAYFSNKLFTLALGETIALFAGGLVSVIIFLITYYTLFLIGKSQSFSS